IGNDSMNHMGSKVQRISSTDDSGIDSPTVADGKLLEEVEALSLSDSSIPITFEVRLASAEQYWSSARDKAVKLRMAESGPGSEAPLTIHQMFQDTVNKYGDHPALRWKENGAWTTLTYKQYYQHCRTAAKSFLKLGLERFHGVGILGFNSPEWFISNVACIMAGGLTTGIYTTNSAEACQYVAHNCEANVIVVENNKQLVKILQVKDQLPHLKAIVQYKGELERKIPNLYTWADFMKLGTDIADDQLDDLINSQNANECCSLIYTSGTTGNPKGVMLSHDNITWIANASGMVIGTKMKEESLVSYLPLSHVAAQVYDLWVSMKFAGTTHFAEPDALKGSLANTLRDVRPTSFLGVPRVWEKMQEAMQSIENICTVKKKIIHKNHCVLSYLIFSDTSVPWGFMLANNLIFKRVRAALGLDRCRTCFTGAAPITKETLEYFMSLNIQLYELYGMSESTGPHTLSWENNFRIMSCGKVIRGCKTKLDKPDEDGNGEVCFWGRHVFMGYLNMPEKTDEALDTEGWLHSGDLGKLDQNDFMYITGRIKELIITAGGENVPPVPIEDALKEEVSIISNAMLVGDKKKFLAMLLTLKCKVDDNGDPTDELTPLAVEYCRQRGVTATKVSEIINNKEPAIYKAIQEGVNIINEKATSNAQRVQKWTLLPRDFSISGGELGKLRYVHYWVLYKEVRTDTGTMPKARCGLEDC
uniref:long-chain-fatty-acid--CoA ligase n=1 Tax=Astyanax mexicanus TaxID=7994 RepID=A0A8B9LDT2_ASTMX